MGDIFGSANVGTKGLKQIDESKGIIGHIGSTPIKKDNLYVFRTEDGVMRFGFVILDEEDMAYAFEMVDDRFPMIMISHCTNIEKVCSMDDVFDECLHFGRLKDIWKEQKED